MNCGFSLPDLLTDEADQKCHNVSQCRDNPHGDGIEHNGLGTHKAAAHQYHHRFPDADSAGCAGCDKADNPGEQICSQKQSHLCRRNVKEQIGGCAVHGSGNDVLGQIDRKSTRLNSSHTDISRMPSSA